MPVSGIYLSALFILFVILFILFYRKIENRFVFFPQTGHEYSPGDFGLEWREVYIKTFDGKQLHGWIFPAEPDNPYILFCHGNAGNISHRLENIKLLTGMKLNILIFDYRGYGKSTGKPSEEGLYRDSLSAYDYLVEKEGILPENIIIFGRSLGAAAAINVAAERTPRSLIIESGFLSTRHMAKNMGIFSLISPFLPANYNNLKKIGLVSSPKLIMHGTEDEIVPFSMGERLFKEAKGPKYFYSIKGAGHNDTYIRGGREYLSLFKEFAMNSRI